MDKGLSSINGMNNMSRRTLTTKKFLAQYPGLASNPVIDDPMFKEPLEVKITLSDRGYYLISSENLPTFGSGKTITGAVNHFCDMVMDLYRELKDKEDLLSPPVRRVLEYMRGIINERT
jgi:hypothetical protein